MANINSSLAFALLILNLCGTITLIGLTADSTSKRQGSYIPQNETNRNFTLTNLNLIELQSQIKSQEKRKEIEKSNLDKDEFALSYKQISPHFSSQKQLRKLSNSNDMALVLLLDLIALFTTFIIIFSFCAEPNECCVENSRVDFCCGLCVGNCLYECCCNPRCRCNCDAKSDNVNCFSTSSSLSFNIFRCQSLWKACIKICWIDFKYASFHCNVYFNKYFLF